MRKIFFLALIAVSMVMGACVEQHNLVVLDKFVPISTQDQCQIKAGGDRYYTKGYIDLAFTGQYLLPFQITNYIASSEVSDVGASGAPISSAETNRFFVKWVEVSMNGIRDLRQMTDSLHLRQISGTRQEGLRSTVLLQTLKAVRMPVQLIFLLKHRQGIFLLMLTILTGWPALF
jgi:hypothetical protein